VKVTRETNMWAKVNKFKQPYQHTEVNYALYIVFTSSICIAQYTAICVFIYTYKYIHTYIYVFIGEYITETIYCGNKSKQFNLLPLYTLSPHLMTQYNT